jgi:hypothetical protein
MPPSWWLDFPQPSLTRVDCGTQKVFPFAENRRFDGRSRLPGVVEGTDEFGKGSVVMRTRCVERVPLPTVPDYMSKVADGAAEGAHMREDQPSR